MRFEEKFVRVKKPFNQYIEEIKEADSPILRNTMNALNIDIHGAALFLAALSLNNNGSTMLDAEVFDDGFFTPEYPFFNYKDVFRLDGVTSLGSLNEFQDYNYPFVKWQDPKFKGTSDDIDKKRCPMYRIEYDDSEFREVKTPEKSPVFKGYSYNLPRW